MPRWKRLTSPRFVGFGSRMHRTVASTPPLRRKRFQAARGHVCTAALQAAGTVLANLRDLAKERRVATFLNGRRYAGTWDESSLADAMLSQLGHRIQSAAFEFVRWGPSSGLLLGLAAVLALVLSNSPLGPAFAAWWETPPGFQWGPRAFAHPLLHWVNHGLLTVFFFVVGLEVKAVQRGRPLRSLTCR
jgi:hypothetical protein